MAENLHWHDHTVSREAKEKLFKQSGKVLWFTGLSGSGKSTLANATEHTLHQLGYKTMVLDGDNIRMGLCKDLGFSDDARKENIRRIAEVAKLFAESGTIVLTAFISPFRSDRDAAREIIGAGSQEELTKRLEKISETMKELDFRFSTGGISRAGQIEQLQPLLAEMQVLTKQQQAINAQPKIDITVNGAIDPEGTSRTIVDTLNNSFYRGTGGANALVTT